MDKVKEPSVYELARARMAADSEKMIERATKPQAKVMKRTVQGAMSHAPDVAAQSGKVYDADD